MIKSFRRGKRLSSSSESGKHVISRVALGPLLKDADILQTPKVVIKALYNYQPQGPDELAFQKGDFFHVLNDNDENEENGWYEAFNPMTNAKGMVPISYFEVFNRSRPKTEEISPNSSKIFASSPLRQSQSQSQRNSSQTLYAVVLFEFKAEREDELDVNPGENLIICAHHDYEWFIAKPINRLGGPGLVPASYVKVVDLVHPNNSFSNETDLIKTVNQYKIPSVEQWKDQTAKYQASTIPLGSISNQTAPASANTQFFQKDTASSRSSLSSSNTYITEAGVDSYLLNQGRYQYKIVARLSNDKVRYLYRYYQDFYDLQVKLLELFPQEAGKLENSKRILPLIPGPLINVNDSISKLRREKLDYYLRTLVTLPVKISRCEEVLRLFDVLDNGIDKEVDDPYDKQRLLKPISQKSNYQQDRLSQYSAALTQQARSTSPNLSDSNLRLSQLSGNLFSSIEPNNSQSQIPTQISSQLPTKPNTKIKVKFYYQDDIFVLLLPVGLRLADLKTKLYKRLQLNNEEGAQKIKLFLKNELDGLQDENSVSDYTFTEVHQMKLKELEIDSDDKFHDVLYDKCKLCILA